MAAHRQLFLAFVTAIGYASASYAATAATVTSRFSGMWYDPARSGEGLQVEILDANSALLEWYTYDEHGAQRWLQGIGHIVSSAAGDYLQFPQIYETHGGNFGPNFNPDNVQIKTVGDLTLTFSDCNSGTLDYHLYGQSQLLPIARLTETMGEGCALNGVPGQPAMAYAGQSGSWYDPSHKGEGFELQWLTINQALVIWYTYDSSGNQVWLLGLGSERNGQIVFDQLTRTSGPHFGTAYDPSSFKSDTWGSLTLQIDCNKGTAHYESSQEGFGSGDQSLVRLTSLAQVSCPTVPSKLSDLYDITWNEIPIAIGTPSQPNYLSAEAIARDGTIAGRRDGHLTLWNPISAIWEDVARELAAQPVDIAPDASTVIATDYITADQMQSAPMDVLQWQRSDGWQSLPGTTLRLSVHYGTSHNFEYVVGTGKNGLDDPDVVWIRAINGSQQILSSTESVPSGYPYAVSDDGKTVVGITLRFPTPSDPEPVAVRWDGNAAPAIMHNPTGDELAVASACDVNCGIVFGAGLHGALDQNHPGEAWYLTSPGVFGYFGAISDAIASSHSYAVTDATPDGSMVVGTYQTYEFPGYPADGIGDRAFVWTEATGIVSMRSLVPQLEIGDDDWDVISSVRISNDGSKILLGGTHHPDQNQITQSRAVVVQLLPKAAPN